MKKICQRVVLGASIAAGVSAIATTPAQAGSLTNVTIGGSAATDYLVYGVQGNNTATIDKTFANVQQVLDGNAASPTGNVELRASSEKANFDFTQNTTLSGTIGGKSLTLSSLVLSDWTSAYKGTTFGQYWFSQVLSANNIILTDSNKTQLFSIFTNYGGFQRFSDPNISYVNQDDTTGKISIGLAGHLNATPLLLQSIDGYLADPKIPLSFKTLVSPLRNLLASTTIQASEIVKYSYDGGAYEYLFGFKATNSGLTESTDGVSHSGNYEVAFQGIAPTPTPTPTPTPIPPVQPTPQPPVQSTPEPSVVLGLAGVVGFIVTQRKLKKISR
ncbi:hypothetical protein NOS3756_06080 [Nostoc sp. NIES-3756]|uniref:NF038130 family PEP-CTERM protein n=1 Tax=Nostoc sp. NIES-3756 TaxID=1751286 RepID=UPI000721B351|nr:NF038130 family PEP-CTERM protein [Nostoc sp. NIES-3756]BAT51681.1 hypothetical protein NOS3756_06080 [Nostoc sp. NIES-3756]